MKSKQYKYAPLEELLKNLIDGELTLTFPEIEKILKDKLPKSAYIHNAWWDNHHDSQSKAWTTANFKPQVFLKDKYVIFKRVDTNE